MSYLQGHVMTAQDVDDALGYVPVARTANSSDIQTALGYTPASTNKPVFVGPISAYSATPFGTYNDATAASFVSNGTSGRAEVLGLHAPSEAATYASRDQVTLYVGQTAPAILAIATGANYTATSLLPISPVPAGIVTIIQAAIAQATSEGRAVGMLIDTNHSPKYTGSVTGIAPDGLSITVSGWFQQSNTAAGQVPSNGVDAYINPVTKAWNINGISTLNVGSFAKSSTFMEGDIYNNQASYTGTGTDFPGAGVSMNCDANDGAYGYLALNNFYTGFLSRGNRSFGSLIQESGGINPPFGFVSYINAASGHHPFAANDAGGGYYFSVTATGGLNLGDPATRNGLSVQTMASGSAPRVTAVGPDTDLHVELRPKGAGYVHAISGLLVDGTINAGYRIGSADAAAQIGASRTANGIAVLNLVSDTTNTAYGARIKRDGAAGVNGITSLDHRGTGDLQVNAVDGANIVFSSGGTTTLTLSAAGNVTMPGTFQAAFSSKAGGPTTTDIPAGRWQVFKNSTSGALALWANDGGVLKSVALT